MSKALSEASRLLHLGSKDRGVQPPQAALKTFLLTFFLKSLRRNTSDSFYETCRLLYGYTDPQGRPAALLSEDVFRFVEQNAAELDAAIDYDRDLGYDYFGASEIR